MKIWRVFRKSLSNFVNVYENQIEVESYKFISLLVNSFLPKLFRPSVFGVKAKR